MTKTTGTILAVMLTSFAFAAHAGAGGDKPGSASGGAAAEKRMPPPPPPAAPKPAPELDRLKPLAGSWSCKGKSPAGSMGPGSPEVSYSSTVTVKPIFDGFAYSVAYDQPKTKTHPEHFAGAWTVGFDSAKKVLVFDWLDNMGDVGAQTATDWSGDDLVLTGEGSGMGKHLMLRDTFTKKGKGIHWKGELKPDGMPDFIVIGEDDCTK